MGQINPESQFGAFLKKIAGYPDVHSIVDIGAWNGLGSTRCLVEGIGNRTDAHVYSFEIDENMYTLAANVWKDNAHVTLQKSRLSEMMMTLDEVESSPNYSNISGQEWRSWYTGEKANFEKSMIGTLPDTIDFVIIDGGEFSGPGDWKTVKAKNPKYVALDDIFTVKTESVLREMISSGEWMVLDHGNDRNGWSILCKN